MLCRSFPLIQTHSHLLRFCPSFSFLQDKAKYTKTQREMNILDDILEILERKRRKKLKNGASNRGAGGPKFQWFNRRLDIFFMVLETKVCLVFKTFIDPYCVLIDELLNFKWKVPKSKSKKSLWNGPKTCWKGTAKFQQSKTAFWGRCPPPWLLLLLYCTKMHTVHFVSKFSQNTGAAAVVPFTLFEA